MHFCSVSRPICGVLLWEPEGTNADPSVAKPSSHQCQMGPSLWRDRRVGSSVSWPPRSPKEAGGEC